MDRKNLDRFYADNTGLIHTVARKGYARLQAIGAATDYEDVFQELSLVFMRAYELFDESAGIQFSSYFMRAAYNELNKIAKPFEIERVELGFRSVEEMNSWSEDGEQGIEERIACERGTPEEELAAAGFAKEMLEQLSPLASALVRMTIDPPEFMEREFYALQAHAEHARSIGIERRARNSLNLSFVCQVLEKTTDLSVATLRAARNEVTRFAERSK